MSGNHSENDHALNGVAAKKQKNDGSSKSSDVLHRFPTPIQRALGIFQASADTIVENISDTIGVNKKEVRNRLIHSMAGRRAEEFSMDPTPFSFMPASPSPPASPSTSEEEDRLAVSRRMPHLSASQINRVIRLRKKITQMKNEGIHEIDIISHFTLRMLATAQTRTKRKRRAIPHDFVPIDSSSAVYDLDYDSGECEGYSNDSDDSLLWNRDFDEDIINEHSNGSADHPSRCSCGAIQNQGTWEDIYDEDCEEDEDEDEDDYEENGETDARAVSSNLDTDFLYGFQDHDDDQFIDLVIANDPSEDIGRNARSRGIDEEETLVSNDSIKRARSEGDANIENDELSLDFESNFGNERSLFLKRRKGRRTVCEIPGTNVSSNSSVHDTIDGIGGNNGNTNNLIGNDNTSNNQTGHNNSDRSNNQNNDQNNFNGSNHHNNNIDVENRARGIVVYPRISTLSISGTPAVAATANPSPSLALPQPHTPYYSSLSVNPISLSSSSNNIAGSTDDLSEDRKRKLMERGKDARKTKVVRFCK